MSATKDKPVLDELLTQQSEAREEIEGLIKARDKAYSEFQARMSGDGRPSESEIERFNARRNHKDENVRPTDKEIAAFDERMNSGPTDEDVRQFNEAHTQRKAEIAAKMETFTEFGQRIDEQREINKGLSIAHEANKGMSFSTLERQRDPLTYREDNQGEVSYFLDLAAMQNQEFRSNPDPRLEGYSTRLETHVKEMNDILPERAERRKRIAEEQILEANRATSLRYGLGSGDLDVSPFERKSQARAFIPGGGEQEERAPSRIVGQGGYAIPPLWLIDEYIPALRPGRVAAGLCRQMPLPDGTDSINIPRLLTPTITGIQTADSAPVASRDFTDTFQQANVKTVAGQEDVPIQLIEESPGQILDRVLMTDLIADYNKQVDLQVIQGTGTGAPLSGGQVVGIYPASNWGATSVTFAGTSFGSQLGSSAEFVPAQSEFFQFLGAMASKTAYNRFNLQDFNFLLHPRRHFWAVSGLDALGRPLGSDDGFGPYNASEVEVDNAPYEGYAGRVPFGPSVYIDANVPITDSGAGVPAGGTADIAIGAIWDDLWLFEGDLRTRVLTEVLSGTLELRFQVYAYIAFLSRYGVSIAIGTAAAMTQPYTYSGSTNGAAF